MMSNIEMGQACPNEISSAPVLLPTQRWQAFGQMALATASDRLPPEQRVDGVDLADGLPRYTDDEVNETWKELVNQYGNEESIPDDVVRQYHADNFNSPERYNPSETLPDGLSVRSFCIRALCTIKRAYSGSDSGALFELPQPPMFVGGRFAIKNRADIPKEEQRSIGYMWDSYSDADAARFFGKVGIEKIRDTLTNFLYLAKRLGTIDEKMLGCVPNSSTSYGSDRSQPDVIPDIVRSLAYAERDKKQDGKLEKAYEDNLELLELSYGFFTDGIDDYDKLGQNEGDAYRRVVRTKVTDPDTGHEIDSFGMRFWRDNRKGAENVGPRDEMYAQDVKDKRAYERALGRLLTPEEESEFYRNIGAAAESGEDFTQAQKKFDAESGTWQLHTTDLISAKQTSAVYGHAKMLADIYERKAKLAKLAETPEEQLVEKAKKYQHHMKLLEATVKKYCISEENGLPTDYDFVEGKQKPPESLPAIVFTLEQGILPDKEGSAALDLVDDQFLRPAGLINTLHEDSNEQWDGRVWPIIQRKAIQAAIQYGRYDLAKKWTEIFLNTAENLYNDENVKAIPEKINPDGTIGNGGEYECVRNLTMSLATFTALKQMFPHIKKMARLQKMLESQGRLQHEHVGQWYKRVKQKMFELAA